MEHTKKSKSDRQGAHTAEPASATTTLDVQPEESAPHELAETIHNSPRALSQQAYIDSLHNSPRMSAQRKQFGIGSAGPDVADEIGREQGEHLQPASVAAQPVQLEGGAVVAPDKPPPTPAEQKEAWTTANQIHGNMLLDAGHISGGILKKIYLWDKYKDLEKRKAANELATEKAHLIEKNMYGRGKIGAVMRNIDTASRIMHLIGSISGAVALAANIAAFFMPAALPVGAVAGVIALAAHAAMVVLQSILIGRNLYRIRGLSEAEKAKILPTLYRDMAKLGFAILGVVTGGVGLGGAMEGGGLMAQHALEGAEAGVHGAHLAGDIVGDTIGTYGMGATIAHQNEKEIAIGMEGGFDHHKKPHSAPTSGSDAHVPAPKTPAPGPAPGPTGPTIASSDPTPELIASTMQADIGESTAAVTSMNTAALDAVDGAGGLKADIKPVDELALAEPNAQQALSALQGVDASTMPETNESDLKDKKAKVEKLEEAVGLPGVPDTEEAAPLAVKGGTKQTKQLASAEFTHDSPTHAASQQTAQLAGEKKPGIFTRAANWLKKKFSKLKVRVQRAIMAVQNKLTDLVLKMAGVKNLPAEMDEGLAEQKVEAQQVMGAAEAGKGAISEWKDVADKIGKK